jgi:hypothetical protein
MDFEDISAFDAWLSRDGNFGRILPHDRCVVAFRIRRHAKDYGDLNPFISFSFNQANKTTFLYIRQGLKVGCHTIGQHCVWQEHMANLYGNKHWGHEGKHGKGPKKIHRVQRMKRDGTCEFSWTRLRVAPKWVNHPTKFGYLQATYPEIEVKWQCPADRLTCVDAYTPGDFHLFFDDPRLRPDYLQWAPILLACEDWHAARSARRENQEVSAS